MSEDDSCYYANKLGMHPWCLRRPVAVFYGRIPLCRECEARASSLTRLRRRVPGRKPVAVRRTGNGDRDVLSTIQLSCGHVAQVSQRVRARVWEVECLYCRRRMTVV
jgi:hypothetical protein